MTMSDWIGDTVARPWFSFQLTLVMAAVAIGLATVGIFGVLSYAVAERTGEIGVRMALGASARTVTRHVVVQGAALTLIGGIIGTVGAAALSRLLTGLLVSVRPLDPATYLGVATILIAATASATYLPARRASRIDPMEALRGE